METRHSEAIDRACRRDLIKGEFTAAAGLAGRDAGGAFEEIGAGTALAAPDRDRGRVTPPADAVRRVQEHLIGRIGPEAHARYFQGRTTMRVLPGALEVRAGTGFLAELLQRRFGSALHEAAAAVFDPAPEIRFGVDESAEAAQAPAPEAAPEPAPVRPSRRPARGGGSSPHPSWHRLEDFIVGPSNRLAFEAAVRVAEGTLGVRSGPLFIHGACGLGKTHLLQGIARRFLERHPGAVVRYTTGEAFTNEFITAVAQGRTMGARGSRGDAFRRAYRDVDLLCIDDVHFLANKSATQNELLHTLDALDIGGSRAGGGGVRIVLASDAHPRAVHRFSEALVSRFLSGLVVQLEHPDTDLCERIVAALAARRAIPMDAGAARAIAEHAAVQASAFRGAAAAAPSTSVRELEGLLTRVEAFWRLDAAPDVPPISRLTVDRALGGIAGPARPQRPVRAESIISVVCQQLGVDPADFAGRGRHHRVVLARSLVAVLARRLTTLSFPEIARAMGRPNHSTIITAYQRLTRQMEAAQPCNLEGPFTGLTLAQLADRLAAMITARA